MKIMIIRKFILLMFAGFVMLTSVQCRQCQKINCQLQTEENKALVLRLVEQAWNKGDMTVIDELLSPDYVLHIAGPGARQDRESYKEAVGMYHKAFPDFHFTIEDMIACGDKVVIRCKLTGTQEGEFMSHPPTGSEVTLTAISIRRIEDGKVVEEWVESDLPAVMRQLSDTPLP
jgi:predicted ester cyclase